MATNNDQNRPVIELKSFDDQNIQFRNRSKSNIGILDHNRNKRYSVGDRLSRFRDSIFINKKNLLFNKNKNGDNDEEDDEEEDDFDEKIDDELHRNTQHNRDSSRTGLKRNSSKVQFANIPNSGGPKVNPIFVSDSDDNLGADGQQQPPQTANNRKSFVQFDKYPPDNFDELLEQIQEKDKKSEPWDSFKSIPKEDEDISNSSDWVKLFLKLSKRFSHLITLILVLFFGVMAKLSLHLMANMTEPDKITLVCNRDLDPKYSDLKPNKPYYSLIKLKSDERIAWIWMLYFVLISPDLLLLIRSVHTCLFKKYSFPNVYYTLMIFVSSSAEVIGISLLVYVILPSLDVITGLVLTNSLFLIPSIFHVWRNFRKSSMLVQIFYGFALSAQILSILLWPLLILYNNSVSPKPYSQDGLKRSNDDTGLSWFIPLAAILISLGYWENFIGEPEDYDDDYGSGDGDGEKNDGEKKKIKHNFLRFLLKIKQSSTISKYAIYLFVSVWKCFLYLLCMLFLQVFLANYYDKSSNPFDMIPLMFERFRPAFSPHKIELISEGIDGPELTITSYGWLPIIVGLMQIFAAFFCYQTINFVCKICIQTFGFALPINLVLPLSVSLADLAQQMMEHDPCWFADRWFIFEYAFFNTHYNLFNQIGLFHFLFYIVWMVTFCSQIIITSHVWISSKERLAPTDQLFMLPLYTASFVDQSLMLNRIIDENLWLQDEEKHDDGQSSRRRRTSNKKRNSRAHDPNNTIKIYACATVWHETADELLQMLKSIMRMDQDQCCRRLAVDCLQVDQRDVDYYEFETHLFVDDAFVKGPLYKKNANDVDINEYVETLIQVLDEAAQNVHQRFIKIKPPIMHITPYGGRIEWILPGNTKLIAHLKDKEKIRHRKRWSQVMYMYYLLGYKIFQKHPGDHEQLAKSTYLLALDGDINFQPEAVLLLVDLMKRDEKLGAACGRVHPVGTGPMAWYQKFEYAISHWLQKATEHVFGCVLCSPGCFSLFRGWALCDTNVMNRYTTKPTEAIHYVQYDQGEDRWLCTLLLQQGWKIEYSAASDSFTHCPEGFDEFYIQRRRWAPSTMANIIDLLQSYKYTVQVNDNISSLYMLYQAGLMLGTILSPGTIFLMLVGATNNSFGMENELSFYLNFIPVIIFILCCFFCKSTTQILIAQLFSTFYAMLMLAVLVSTGIEIYEETIFSPSVIFFVGMLTIFIISALIHPQEILCLLPVVIYLLAIPSMYLLLTLYSIINLNIVTWGTRENPQTQEPKPEEKVEQKPKGFLNEISQYFNRYGATKSSKTDFSCVCCATTKQNDDEIYILKDIKESVDKVITDVNEIKTKNRRRSTFFHNPFVDNNRESMVLSGVDDGYPIEEGDEDVDGHTRNEEHDDSANDPVHIDLRRPKWIHNKNLKNARARPIDGDEKKFWTRFVKKYLKPLDKDSKHEKKVHEDLIQLRNRAFFALGIINIIFVLFVYLMQLHKDIFSFEIVYSHRQNGTRTGTIDGELRDDIPVYLDKKIQMDPVGLILIIFFGSIMIIQFIGMILHRLGTLTHLLAFTDLQSSRINTMQIKETDQLDKNALQIVRKIIDFHDPDELNKEKEYVFFDMEKFFLQSIYKVMDPKFAYDIVKQSNTNTNVSRRALGAELSRRSSIFIDNILHGSMNSMGNDADNDGTDSDTSHNQQQGTSKPTDQFTVHVQSN